MCKAKKPRLKKSARAEPVTPLRVLMITHSVWDYVHELARRLAEHCELTVACNHFDWSDEWSGGQPYDIVRLPTAAGAGKLGRALVWAHACRRLVRRLKPDLVHLQVANPSVTATLRAMGVPIVVTVHDPTLHLGERSLPQRIKHWANLRFADWFVVHGPEAAATLERMGKEASRILVHEHGPLTMYGGPGGYQKSTGDTVLFFGRIQPYKGLEHLLRAVEILDRPLELVIAGEGNRGYLDRCLRATRLKPTVHWGFVDRALVTRLFQDAAIVCTPYVDASQSGVIAIAKAMGRASVATATGDLPFAVQAPKYGLVVAPRDASELAGAQGKLLDDVALRHAMERRALDYTAADRWNDVAEQVARQYRRWLDR